MRDDFHMFLFFFCGQTRTVDGKRTTLPTSNSNRLHSHANHANKSWRSDLPIILPGWEHHTGGSRSIPQHTRAHSCAEAVCSSKPQEPNTSRMVAEPCPKDTVQGLNPGGWQLRSLQRQRSQPPRKRRARWNELRSRQLRPSRLRLRTRLKNRTPRRSWWRSAPRRNDIIVCAIRFRAWKCCSSRVGWQIDVQFHKKRPASSLTETSPLMAPYVSGARECCSSQVSPADDHET